MINKYDYKPLERDTKQSGERVYNTPIGSFASVTTILSATADTKGLDAWRAWVGEEAADKIRDEAARLGSLMHLHLENHLLGESRPGGTNLIRVMAKNMADVIIENGLKNVSDVWGIEAPLYHPDGYAGTTDLVGIHNGSPAIMDFKTTKKQKKKDFITDYFCQCAAYAHAHNYLFGTDIRKVVIFMVSRDNQYQEFIIEDDEFDMFLEIWLTRVRVFNRLKEQGPIR
jgi:genome maintenance exonuclease 1